MRGRNVEPELLVVTLCVAALLPVANAAAFSQADLTGEWATYTRFDVPGAANAPGYRHGITGLDASGNVISGGDTDDTGTFEAHTGGSTTPNAVGVIEGSITNVSGTDSFSDHQLDLSGTVFVGVDTEPTGTRD